MSGDLIVFLVFLLVVAAFVNGDFAITIAYLFIGAFLLGQLWVRHISKAVRYDRIMDSHAFWGEYVPVRIKVSNPTLLPVPWLQIYESIPVNLVAGKPVKQVINLGPHGRAEIDYRVHARKRGYYPIGPLFVSLGDMLGLFEIRNGKASTDYLTVYPRIIPLTRVSLPSYSPLGTLRINQPIFDDPSRILSKRDYTSGDSLRRIDWKASAVAGKLQVKQYELSIELEAVLFLNMNSSDYAPQVRIDLIELAIIIAASLANWVTLKKQSIGLVTNGVSVLDESGIQPILPHKGRAHLMRILETLAQVQAKDAISITRMLQMHGSKLSWGTTIVIITGQIDDALFDEVFETRRRGQKVVLIVAGRASHVQTMKNRAENFNLPFYSFTNVEDLDLWRK